MNRLDKEVIMLKKLALLMCLVSVCNGAQIIRYVDTDTAAATADQDGTTEARAYDCLNDCMQAEEQDLTDGAGDYFTVYVSASAGTADINSVSIDSGWTCDTTNYDNYIEIIQTDAPADGIWSDSVYRLVKTNDNSIVIAGANTHVYLKDLQVGIIATSGSRYAITGGGSFDAACRVYIDSCRIKLTGDSGGAAYGVIAGTSGVWTIYNTYVWGDGAVRGYAYRCSSMTSGNFNVYNSLAYNMPIALSRYLLGTFTATNTTIVDCAIAVDGIITVDYCLSLQGVGTNAQTPASGSTGTMGSDPISRPSALYGPYTILLQESPAAVAGKITAVRMWTHTDLSGCKVGTFYLVSGTTYKCRDTETIGTVPEGPTAYTGLDIDVESGDLLGVYWASGAAAYTSSGGSGMFWSASDTMTVDNETAYSENAAQSFSFQALIDFDWTIEYADLTTGNFQPLEGSNQIDNGTDDPSSGVYSDDILDAARTSTWSIGPYELGESAAGGQFINLITSKALRWNQEIPICLDARR